MKRNAFLIIGILLVLVLTQVACERSSPRVETTTDATATPATTDSNPIVIPTTPPLQNTPGSYPAPSDNGGQQPTPTVAPDQLVLPTAEAQPTTPPPAAAATAVPPTPSATGEIIHTVQVGENLFRIGLQYGFSYQELAAYNGIADVNSIQVGQQIRIPPAPTPAP